MTRHARRTSRYPRRTSRRPRRTSRRPKPNPDYRWEALVDTKGDNANAAYAELHEGMQREFPGDWETTGLAFEDGEELGDETVSRVRQQHQWRKRRTSRRPKPNPIPSPPTNPLAVQSWFLRTFPVGTSVVWKKDQDWQADGQLRYTIPRGIKAQVVSHDPTQYGGSTPDNWIVARFLKVVPGVSDPAILQFEDHLQQATGKPLHELEFGLEPEDAVNGTVWPLMDTWGPAPRARGRYALPRSQRSSLKPNIPFDQLSVPPPGRSSTIGQIGYYYDRTLMDGTPLVVRAPTLAYLNTGQRRGQFANLPAGARLESFGGTAFDGRSWSVEAEVVDARDAYGFRMGDVVGEYVVVDIDKIEPLEDTWASQHGSAKGRHALPRSQRSSLKPNETND